MKKKLPQFIFLGFVTVMILGSLAVPFMLSAENSAEDVADAAGAENAEETAFALDAEILKDPVAVLSEITCLEDDVKDQILDRLSQSQQSQTEGDTLPLSCSEAIDACFQKQFAEFGATVDPHLKNAEPNSHLVSPVLDLFRAMKRESRNLYFVMSLLRPTPKSPQPQSLDIKVDELSECSQKQQSLYDDLMEPVIYDFIMDTANAKRSYILVNKYKEINDKLSRLNDSMGKWYGYMSTIAQKIPNVSSYCQ